MLGANRSIQLDACADALAGLTRRLDGLERADADWEEHKHPRDNAGKFSSKGGGGGAKAPEAAAKAAKSSEVPTPEVQKQAGDDIKSFLGIVKNSYPTQKSTHSIVSDHGRQFFADAGTYAGKRGRPQQCYKNAAVKALEEPDKYTYVEGFVTVHGVPIEHAWVVDKDGRVLDPTITDPEGIGAYYGVPFRSEYVQETLLKNKVYGMFGHFNRDIYGAPSEEFVQRDAGGRSVSKGAEEKPPKTPATSLFEQHEVPPVDEFIRSLPREAQEHINHVAEKLRNAVSTDAPVSKGGHREPSGRFTKERQQLHAQIIRKILTPEKVKAARPEPGRAPTFTVLGGRAGSGKSFVTREGGPVDSSRAIVVDSDAVKAMLPEYQGWNASMCHEEASHVIEHVMASAKKLKLNIVLDGTMKSFGPMAERLESFRADGYKTEGYYVFAPPAVAARRAVARSMNTGRFVTPSYVLSSTSNERSFDALRDKFHRWKVYDNSSDDGQPVEKFSGGDD